MDGLAPGQDARSASTGGAPGPGLDATRRDREFLFLTDLYETKWSSIRFYADLMADIREVLEDRGHRTRSVMSPDDAAAATESTFVLDNAAIIALAREGMLEAMLARRYALIIGENIDGDHGTFVGWRVAAYLRHLDLHVDGMLWKLIRGAERVTWQNEPVRQLLLRTLPADRVLFFPISGYRPSQVVPSRGGPLDVDLLLYGTMAYERRSAFVRELFVHAPDLRVAVLSNVFGLDDLLARSRIVLHVNSVDGCTHVPFAKIIKPLVNEKLLFVEQSDELATSDLAPFVQQFDLSDIPGLFVRIRDTLARFDEEQQRLRMLDPRSWIERHYDLDRNVASLLGL